MAATLQPRGSFALLEVVCQGPRLLESCVNIYLLSRQWINLYSCQRCGGQPARSAGMSSPLLPKKTNKKKTKRDEQTLLIRSVPLTSAYGLANWFIIWFLGGIFYFIYLKSKIAFVWGGLTRGWLTISCGNSKKIKKIKYLKLWNSFFPVNPVHALTFCVILWVVLLNCCAA